MTSVVDKYRRPIKDLRISVTDRCNFRCPYCMPAEIFGERYSFLDKSKTLSFEEIVRLAQIFVSLGVKKVCLTGGEPLIRRNLQDLVSMLSEIPGIDDLTLTTNGYFLAEKAKDLKNAGLHRVTVSLDSIHDEVFQQMNGRGYKIQRVLDGIKEADHVGLSPIKINVVVQKGVNDFTVVDTARYFKESGYIVRFIEYMDVGNINGWKLEHVVSAQQILDMINAEMPLQPLEKNHVGEVAERYRYKDGIGEIGIIASVSKPFCRDCSRTRVSSDGKLYTCLYAGLGHNLRDMMRSGMRDDELRDVISGVWIAREDRYSEDRNVPNRRIEFLKKNI